MSQVIKMRCDFENLTHMIIRTGYAPDLEKCAEIEEQFHGKLSVSFSCESNWLLGMYIPSPLGFERPHRITVGTRDDAVRQINQIMESKKSQPFYELANDILKRQLAMNEDIFKSQPNRMDLYQDLVDNVITWGMKPILPQSLTTSEGRICASFENRSKQSYQKRLEDTRKILSIYPDVDGCIGFKIRKTINPLTVMKKIQNAGLDYCRVFSMTGFEYIEKDNMNLLVLNYDAEHG